MQTSVPALPEDLSQSAAPQVPSGLCQCQACGSPITLPDQLAWLVHCVSMLPPRGRATAGRDHLPGCTCTHVAHWPGMRPDTSAAIASRSSAPMQGPGHHQGSIKVGLQRQPGHAWRRHPDARLPRLPHGELTSRIRPTIMRCWLDRAFWSMVRTSEQRAA